MERKTKSEELLSPLKRLEYKVSKLEIRNKRLDSDGLIPYLLSITLFIATCVLINTQKSLQMALAFIPIVKIIFWMIIGIKIVGFLLDRQCKHKLDQKFFKIIPK